MALYRSWSDLPIEILQLVVDHLRFADHVRFGVVCSSWRSASKNSLHLQALRFPWLLSPEDPPSKTIVLFSPMEGRVHRLTLPLSQGSRWFGSNRGWLLLAHDSHVTLLFNPLTNHQIQLPHASTAPEDRQGLFWNETWHRDYFWKAIFSAELSAPNVFAEDHSMLILQECSTPHICVIGGRESPHSSFSLDTLGDKIFFEGLLYSLDGPKELCVRQLGRLVVTIKEVIMLEFTPKYQGHCKKYHYLVECKGELLMAIRYFDHPYFYKEFFTCKRYFTRTTHFDVYKLDRSIRKWVHVESLGDEVLFVSKCCSRSFTAANSSGFRGNCIYFVDFIGEFGCTCGRHRNYDQGVFCLEDGKIQPLLPEGLLSLKDPPFWFMPNA